MMYISPIWWLLGVFLVIAFSSLVAAQIEWSLHRRYCDCPTCTRWREKHTEKGKKKVQ